MEDRYERGDLAARTPNPPDDTPVEDLGMPVRRLHEGGSHTHSPVETNDIERDQSVHIRNHIRELRYGLSPEKPDPLSEFAREYGLDTPDDLDEDNEDRDDFESSDESL